MHPSEGFILGLSTGVICIAYCGPVLLPYLMGEGNSVGKSFWYVTLFLMGRLIAYLFMGVVAGLLGAAFLQNSGFGPVVMGVVNIVLAVMLILY